MLARFGYSKHGGQLMTQRSGAFVLREGDIWEASYCSGDWGTPEATGSQYARRIIRGLEGAVVLYEDRAGELRRVSVGLFESWIRSQGGRMVGTASARTIPPSPRPQAGSGASLSIAQAAAEAGVTPTTIYYYVKKGALPVSGEGRARRIAREDWERFRRDWR